MPKWLSSQAKGPNPFGLGPQCGLAERTGLEPATSDVTGRRSNQLNYRSALLLLWWAEQGSNL